MIQLLVKKDKVENSAKNEYEVHKARQEEPMCNDLGKIHYLSSSSHISFKVEEKIEIPMYDGQTNVKVLNNWLKQLEILLWSLSNPRNSANFLFPFEDDHTFSTMMGELCGCSEDIQEDHVYKMEGLQGIIEVTILSHRL
jgi:hypothetical protein